MTTFTEKLGYEFQRPELLAQAFTHKSFHNENIESSPGHNERLEFLGDAVLDLSLSDLLFRKFPDLSEGALSKIRASLVNEVFLAELALEYEMDRLIQLGRGEQLTGGSAKPRLLASVFEAFIGAYYLDAGLTKVDEYIRTVFGPRVGRLDLTNHYASDFKSRLQERLQELHKQTPIYKLVREEGPDHEKVFYCSVLLGKEKLAEGIGRSKKAAEQDAARLALEQLK